MSIALYFDNGKELGVSYDTEYDRLQRRKRHKGDLSATVELKSVNYRFKEVNARLPRSLLYVEDKLKQTILRSIYSAEE